MCSAPSIYQLFKLARVNLLQDIDIDYYVLRALLQGLGQAGPSNSHPLEACSVALIYTLYLPYKDMCQRWYVLLLI